jgi:lambda repressor-like predicted transcriptional regulator
MKPTEFNQIELAHALLYAMKSKGWSIRDLAIAADVPKSEIETILRGEFDFGIIGKIQDDLNEQIIQINKK